MAASGRCGLVLRLFETYYERVYWFSRKSVDATTAEDVAQEVFMRLLRIPDLEERVVTVSYLLKVADNLIKRRHKQRVQHERFAARGAGGRREDVGSGFEPAGESSAAFDRLTNAEHDALRLIVCEGLSYEDAARSLDVKVSTVNNWKFRGIQKLRDPLGVSPANLAG
ncbi:MAG: RNA polymerase sigma factor [Phycisphaeraceae bacterium]|nr:MAG: RNA polymerase sigma factor [Phycisphaeraceae bacterium]